ncbi:RraA family protein [Microbacterium sp. LWS13-1.2]|uniref:Putative 4-hydroxy-4-methyl-2-oxoglutarate aldolase n=1 Tax=Microbacterium sp. LWS13-1.2 TaxID=3135264 RepID=A0AAU6SE51_9MICO
MSATLGLVPTENIHPSPAPIAPDVLARYMELEDVTGTVSDALDQLGIAGTVGSSILKPTMPGRQIVGPALTLRHDPVSTQPALNAAQGVDAMAEVEAHHVAQPGDVLVIQGMPDVSAIGGLSAAMGKRQGELGAVVDGGIRDVSAQRAIDFPIWSTSISPITGKWRVATTEVNGPVRIHDVLVQAGDVVVADDTGVCFVPRDHVLRVLEICESIVAKENAVRESIDANVTIADITAGLSKMHAV